MATVNLDSFLREMNAEGEAATAGVVDTIVRKTTFDLARDLVLGMPVGNPDLWAREAPEGYIGGHARRNVQVTVGDPAEVELDGVDESGDAALADAQAVLEGELPKFPLVYVSVPVPYIMGPNSLNEGHSTQAPAGFVDDIVDRRIQDLQTEFDANG